MRENLCERPAGSTTDPRSVQWKIKRVKETWLNVAEYGAVRVYTLVIGVVSLFLTARVLGPEGRGMLASLAAWVGLFATFAGLSLGQIVQFRVQKRKTEDWLPTAFCLLLLSAGVLATLAWLTAGILYFTDAGSLFRNIPGSLLILAFALLPLLMWEEYSSNLLAAAGRLRTYNLAQFTGRSVWIVLLVLLMQLPEFSVGSALTAQLAGQAVLCLISIVVIWRAAGRRLDFNRDELAELLKGSAKLHLNTVCGFLLAQTSVLMLNHFVTKSEVGYFQLAYQITVILLLVPHAVSTVLFSKMSAVGPDVLWPEQKRLGWQTAGLMLVLSALAYFLAPPVILLLAGPAFEPAIEIFHLLLPNVIGLTFAQLMSCQWIGRGVFVLSTVITFALALANILANLVLIPRYGVLGAIWSSWLCLVLTILAQGGYAYWCELRYRKFIHSNAGSLVP